MGQRSCTKLSIILAGLDATLLHSPSNLMHGMYTANLYMSFISGPSMNGVTPFTACIYVQPEPPHLPGTFFANYMCVYSSVDTVQYYMSGL